VKGLQAWSGMVWSVLPGQRRFNKGMPIRFAKKQKKEQVSYLQFIIKWLCMYREKA
jgi:hypothetical protein